jgi:hypothetical protein
MEQRMPLARYFLYVGGVLLTLLFILDACLTKLPVMERAHANLPVIRIHSDRKWPERIVYDTTLPTIVPAPTAIVEDRVPSPATVADVSVKEREREAFALMQQSDTRRLQPSDPGKRELKLQRQRKIAKIAKRRAPPALLVARQLQFGWFGYSTW